MLAVKRHASFYAGILVISISLIKRLEMFKIKLGVNMGQKDSASKKYMENNEIFADAFNMLIHKGNPVIKPSELTELNTTELATLFDTKKLGVIRRYRDVLKLLTIKKTDRVAYVILGIENQSNIHYAMPVRNMLYDAIQYSNQIENLAKKACSKRADGSSEFISDINADDKLIPVITLPYILEQKIGMDRSL